MSPYTSDPYAATRPCAPARKGTDLVSSRYSRATRRGAYAIMSIIVALAFPVAQQARAQGQNNDGQVQKPDDVSTLKEGLKVILAQQRQILDQLDELKHLLSVSAASPSHPPVPTTLNVHGELFRGNERAVVAIIEYSDFECPYCGKYERDTSPQILENYIKTGKVKLYYRDLTSPTHPRAIPAARAARCAGEQDKYWEMHDSLFATQGALSDAALENRAQVLALDTKRFNECFSSGRYADELQKALEEAEKMGIDGTPTFFIGAVDARGETMTVAARISGAHPFETFRSALDEVLAPQNQQLVQSH